MHLHSLRRAYALLRHCLCTVSLAKNKTRYANPEAGDR
jgi:hypothetical protein